MAHPTENGVEEDFGKHNERSSFKEPIVLVGIIFLSVLNGLITIQQEVLNYKIRLDMKLFYGLPQLGSPISGTVGMAFMSEFTGRKPVFITLFALSVLSSVLCAIPSAAVWSISSVIHSMVTGAIRPMTFLAISEYSSPRHRFAYLMANTAAGLLSADIIRLQCSIFYELYENGTSLLVFQVLTIIFGLACLGSTWVWPESPYWLASKGKLVESKRVFLWLRGKQSETEFRTLKQEQRRPGPPQLYWLPLLIAIAILSISQFSNFPDTIFEGLIGDSMVPQCIPVATIQITIICSTIFISYKVNRKLLFTVGSVVPLLLCYVLAAWLGSLGIPNEPPTTFLLMYFINSILRRLGPIMLGMSIFIETIPLKYKTHMTCVCFVCYHTINTFYIHLMVKFLRNLVTSLLLFPTLALGGVVLFHFLAQEPKDKTLLEIQKSYTPKENVTSLEPEPITMQRLQNEKDELEV